MKKEILFVAAGTRGAKLVGGRFQPYVPIHGRTSVEHVLAAATEAESVDRIYVWGDRERLETLLREAVVQGARRGVEVTVLQEKSNFVESFLSTTLLALHQQAGHGVQPWMAGEGLESRHWDLWREFGQDEQLAQIPVNLLVSDTPLIQPAEIDCLVAGKSPHADLVLGRTVRSAIDTVTARIPEPFCYDRAVKNYYTYGSGDQTWDLIVNNFMAGKPLRVPRLIWNLAGHLFNNRTIIEGGRFNLKKIKDNVVFVQSLFSKFHRQEAEGGAAAKKNYYQMLKAFSFLMRAYFIIVKNKDANRKFRDLAILEDRIRTLTRCTVTLLISDASGPALDIDTEYEIEYIDRHFEALRASTPPTVLF
ncbi:MAG: NTP transferase domain-containing protein [Magnetococcales bacterium]|nr:NTP transferase domain-containing protein [Magnetococcales bacterium]